MLVAKHGGRNRVVAASSLVGRKFPPSRTSPSSRIVRLLLDSLAIRDPETARHCQRVSQYSTLLAKQLGLGENEIWIAEVGALLHDIGKMGLPDRVLQKRSTLDPSERELVNLSLDTSYDIARNAFGDGPVSEAVRGSRVWYQDASRFNGGRLPIAARIVAIADAYDAMISPHSYREGFSREQAIEELERCSGTQFDGELVRHFNAMVNVREG
ncbi:MAG: HD domain-containing protein [Planctomycetota bacterium]